MAKRKSKKSKKSKFKGSKPIPTGNSDDAPSPGYQLLQTRLADERFEQSCTQVYAELQALVSQAVTQKRFQQLADKGFQEAQERTEGQRWPLFDDTSEVSDVGSDLPQACSVLLMFHDVFQENQGWATHENALITPEMRIEDRAAISELRQQVSDYYYHKSGEADLLTTCMIHLKRHFDKVVKKRSLKPERTSEQEIRYTEIQCEKRTLIIGEKKVAVGSNKVWEFLKELCSSRQHNMVDPKAKDWKNAYDQLRRIVKTASPGYYEKSWHSFVHSNRGGYQLGETVKITGAAQMRIKR